MKWLFNEHTFKNWQWMGIFLVGNIGGQLFYEFIKWLWGGK